MEDYGHLEKVLRIQSTKKRGVMYDWLKNENRMTRIKTGVRGQHASDN